MGVDVGVRYFSESAKSTYHREYRLKNKEKIRQQQKEYQLKNKARISLIKKDYASKHKQLIKIQQKEYQINNKLKIQNQKRQYRLLNADKIRQNKILYVLNNKEKIRMQKHVYYLKNKKVLQEKKKIYCIKNKKPRRNKVWTDPDQVRLFFEYASKELHITDPRDWYRISASQMKEIGGGSLYPAFGNLGKALQYAYPDIHWDLPKFSSRGKKAAQRYLGRFLTSRPFVG
eukprot:TRINITY_DN14839_c0_g3_i2.p1 TRINITY_DN14839_c0_g3~~TRINITY_DN14839_c0_g3_i2.p1  ORF type:complete len:256 (+),score=59.03 TRINITY_DN14839_c0_g3_i2:81-770(+)